MVSRRRGKPSNNRLDGATIATIEAALRPRYADFGATPRTRMGIGLSRVLFGAGRTRTSLEFMGFDADKRPEGADWPVEAHECPTPEPRAAVNPRVSDREAAARVSEAGLTASTGSGPRRGRTADKAGAGEGPALPWAMFQSTSGKA